MDIEAVAATSPEKILSFSIDPTTSFQPYHGRRIAFMLGLEGKQLKQCISLMSTLYNLFVDKDMEMLEINPLKELIHDLTERLAALRGYL